MGYHATIVQAKCLYSISVTTGGFHKDKGDFDILGGLPNFFGSPFL